MVGFSIRQRYERASNGSWENVNKAKLGLSRSDKTMPRYVMQKDRPTDRRLGAAIEISFIQESRRKKTKILSREVNATIREIHGETTKGVEVASYSSWSMRYVCTSYLRPQQFI